MGGVVSACSNTPSFIRLHLHYLIPNLLKKPIFTPVTIKNISKMTNTIEDRLKSKGIK